MDASIHVIQPFQPIRAQPDRQRRDRGTKKFDLDTATADAPGATRPHADGEDLHAHGASVPANEEGTGERLDVIA